MAVASRTTPAARDHQILCTQRPRNSHSPPSCRRTSHDEEQTKEAKSPCGTASAPGSDAKPRCFRLRMPPCCRRAPSHDEEELHEAEEREEIPDASIFEKYSSLNNAVVGGSRSPAVLLQLSYLLELHEQKRIIPCRQELPSHAKFNDMIDDRVVTLVLSYCWCTPEHPDPEGRILADVCQFGQYLLQTGLQGCSVVVFWDFASLYQCQEGRPRTAPQERSFQAGLALANVLYAHTKTWVLMCTHAYRRVAYIDSGWPFFEWSVAQFIKHPDLCTDLPIALRFIKQMEAGKNPLNRSLQHLQEACRRHARRLIWTPETFNAAMEMKTFARVADQQVLQWKYRQTFQAVVQPAKRFLLRNMPCAGRASWRVFLSGTVPRCANLRELDVSCNEAIASTLEPFAGLCSLEILRISLCTGFRGTLQPLGGLVQLRALEAVGCLGLQGNLEPLSALTELRQINFQACIGLQGSLAPLRRLAALEAVDVRGTVLEGWYELAARGPCLSDGFGPDEAVSPWLLCRAAYYNMERTIELLLLHCGTVDGARDDGFTPLLLAAENGHSEVVRLLFKYGASVDLAESSGATPLFMAAQNGHLTIAQLLLQQSANTGLADDDGTTPLLMAAQQGHSDLVHVLLKQAADADLAENTGRTPLFLAAASGHLGASRTLIQHGATLDRVRDNGASPMVVAALQGHNQVVKLLLQHHASANLPDNDGSTPLSWAAENGHSEVAESLLVRHAAVNQADSSGCTPLFWAASNGHVEAVWVLLGHGAAVDLADDGHTPLHIAAQKGHHEAIGILLEHTASVNRADREGATPLYVAANGGHGQAARLLLEHSAFADKADNDGTTPLYMAARHGHFEAVFLLLYHDAGVDLMDAEGITPLNICAQNGHAAVMRLLLDHGAAANRVDSDGRPLLYMAAKSGHREAVRLLLEAGAADGGFASLLLHAETEGAAPPAEEMAGGPALRHLGGPEVRHEPRACTLRFGRGLTTVGAAQRMFDSGVLYYEVTILATLGQPLFGFATHRFRADESGDRGVGGDAESWAADGLQQSLWHKGLAYTWGCKWAVGDIIGLAANMDVGKIAISRNGNWSHARHGIIFQSERIKSGVFPCMSASFYAVRYNLDGMAHGAFAHRPPLPSLWTTRRQCLL